MSPPHSSARPFTRTPTVASQCHGGHPRGRDKGAMGTAPKEAPGPVESTPFSPGAAQGSRRTHAHGSPGRPPTTRPKPSEPTTEPATCPAPPLRPRRTHRYRRRRPCLPRPLRPPSVGFRSVGATRDPVSPGTTPRGLHTAGPQGLTWDRRGEPRSRAAQVGNGAPSPDVAGEPPTHACTHTRRAEQNVGPTPYREARLLPTGRERPCPG